MEGVLSKTNGRHCDMFYWSLSTWMFYTSVLRPATIISENWTNFTFFQQNSCELCDLTFPFYSL